MHLRPFCTLQDQAVAGQEYVHDDLSVQDVEDECTGLQMPFVRAITEQPHSNSEAGVYCNPGVPVPHAMVSQLEWCYSFECVIVLYSQASNLH